MYCYKCIYWDKKNGKCTLTSNNCLSDKIYDPDNPDHERDIGEKNE